MNDNPTLAQVLARRKQHRHAYPDMKVALVIEGGGMRGVVSSGMITALEHLGLTSTFDIAIGTSAGAIAAAYFVAGQAEVGTQMYFDHLVGREWIDWRRILARQPLIAMNHLFGAIEDGDRSLDLASIKAAATALYATASKLPDYSLELFGDLRGSPLLLSALKASCRIPVAAGQPVEIDGRKYLDGSLSQSIPVASAADLGATHCMVLLTRPSLPPRGKSSSMNQNIVYPLMDRFQPGIREVQMRRAAEYKREIDYIQSRVESGSTPTCLVAQVPGDEPAVRQLEQDRVRLLRGAEVGYDAVYQALAEQPDRNPFRP